MFVSLILVVWRVCQFYSYTWCGVLISMIKCGAMFVRQMIKCGVVCVCVSVNSVDIESARKCNNRTVLVTTNQTADGVEGFSAVTST